MEDSTAMTVEFLRARLLAERSVSKTAKQRADELAQKVLELEQQLKRVTQPRKEAEKATEKVLAILDNNGIGDCSESFDSNSDQERLLYDSKDDDKSMEEENGFTSREGKSEEDISGSEHEGSLLSGRSLSWKGCKDDSPNSVEKKKYFELRRQCSFLCTSDSTTRQRAGKSCRKIKQTVTIEAEPSGVATDPEENSEIVKNNRSESVTLIDEGYLEDNPKETIVGLNVSGSERESGTEIEPADHVQLIDQNETEANAQRENEEDFKENASCTPESCGNQSDNSDVKEETDDIRGSAEPPDTISTQELEAKLETNSEFSFPSQENSISIYQLTEKPETPRVSSEQHDNESRHSGESSSDIQNDLQIEIWHEKPPELDSVLESLQRAKLALKQEINRSQPGWPLGKIRERNGIDSVKIPNCYTGLFRVPTDLERKATTQPNFSPFVNPYYDPLIDVPTTSRFNYPSYAEFMTPTPTAKKFPGMRSEMQNGDCPPMYYNHDRINVQQRRF